MHEQIFFGDAVAELDDFEFETVQPDALVAILSEDERLAVFELHDVLAARVFLGDVVPCAVIEDVAVLQNLHVGGAFVRGRFFQSFFQVLLENVHGTRDEGGFGADRQRNGIERAVGGAERSGFRLLADFGRGRILALGKSVDADC